MVPAPRWLPTGLSYFVAKLRRLADWVEAGKAVERSPTYGLFPRNRQFDSELLAAMTR